MPKPHSLAAQFTLLYADPNSPSQRQYLQPLYGLTLPPEASEEETTATHPPASADNNSSPTGSVASPTGSEARAASPASPRRPHRQVDLINTGLFPEQPPEGLGPQPVFGGCFLGPADHTAPPQTPAAVHFQSDGSPTLTSVLHDSRERGTLTQVRRKHESPPGRSGHLLLSSRDLGALVFHGGLEDSLSCNDTWLFDVTTHRWRKLACHGKTRKVLRRVGGKEEVVEEDGPMPPRAFGQVGALFHSREAGDGHDAGQHPQQQPQRTSKAARSAASLRMFLAGGIRANDKCVRGSYVLNPHTGEWTVMELTVKLPAVWGSVAECVKVKRHRPHPSRAAKPPARKARGQTSQGAGGSREGRDGMQSDKGRAEDKSDEEEEEEVIVLFGGMTADGQSMPNTYVIHPQRRLTEEEVLANPHFFLKNICYDEEEEIRHHLQMQKAREAEAALGGGNSAGNGNHGPTSGTSAAETSTFAENATSASVPADVIASLQVLLGRGSGNGDIQGTTNDSEPDSEGDEDEDSDSEAGSEAAVGNGDAATSGGPNGGRRGRRTQQSQKALPEVTATDIASFRSHHQDTLADWRVAALRTRVVGRYLVENLGVTEGLPGRRRAASCVFQKHFMFIFGGRDEYGYYNDFWVFNAQVRRWIQIRDEVPTFWLRLFFSQPENDTAAVAIANINAQVRAARSNPERNEKNNSSFDERSRLRFEMFRQQYIHDNLYASTLNSTAKARTGSVLFVDEVRKCVYVFGGFTLSRNQLWTFCDVHAYFIDFHCWRRVSILPSRPFDLRYVEGDDAGEVAVMGGGDDYRPTPLHRTQPENTTTAEPASTSLWRSLQPQPAQPTVVTPNTEPAAEGSERRTTTTAATTTTTRYLAPSNWRTSAEAEWRRQDDLLRAFYGTDGSDATTRRASAHPTTSLDAVVAQERQDRWRPSILHRVSPLLDATLLHNAENARLARHAARFESTPPQPPSPLTQPQRGHTARAPLRSQPSLFGSQSGLLGGSAATNQYPNSSSNAATTNIPAAAEGGAGTTHDDAEATSRAVPPRPWGAPRMKDVAPRVSTYNADAESLVGMTLTRLAESVRAAGQHSTSVPASTYPPKMVAPRYGRFELMGATHDNSQHLPDATEGYAVPVQGNPGRHHETRLFHLPITAPEARTMAAVAADPFNHCLWDSASDDDDESMEGVTDEHGATTRNLADPSQGLVPARKRRPRRYYNGEARFFLHGGRAGEDVRGDLFEVRIKAVNGTDFDYHQTMSLLNRWVYEQEHADLQLVQQQQQSAASLPLAGVVGNGAGEGLPSGGSPRGSTAATAAARPPPPAPLPPASIPPMNTLNSPSNPNLNPMHPPTAAPAAADRRVHITSLLDLYTRCAAVARHRLLHEMQKRQEEERRCDDRSGFNPCVPHGRYQGYEGGDAYAMNRAEKERTDTVFFAAFSFLKDIIDLPVRHRGDSVSAREAHRNIPILNPATWHRIGEDSDSGLEDDEMQLEESVAPPHVLPCAQRHQTMTQASESAIALLTACMATPTAAMGVTATTTTTPPRAAFQPRGLSASLPLARTLAAQRGAPAELHATTTTTTTTPPRPTPARGVMGGFPSLGAIGSTTVDSPPLSPTESPSLALPEDTNERSRSIAPGRPRAPGHSFPGLRLTQASPTHTPTAPPAPPAPPKSTTTTTHSLAYTHIQLLRLLQPEPYYYSGVNYAHPSNPSGAAVSAASSLSAVHAPTGGLHGPMVLLLGQLRGNEGETASLDDTTRADICERQQRVRGVAAEPNPQAARAMAHRLPLGFLEKLSLDAD